MQRMRAKEFLQSVLRQRRMVEVYEREANEARADIESLKAARMDADKVTGTRASDLADKVAKIEKYLDRVASVKAELYELRSRAIDMIDRLENSYFREILRRRYIGGDRWEKIAVDMGYDIRWIYRMHGRALQSLDKILSD